MTAIEELVECSEIQELQPLGGLEGALEQPRSCRRDIEEGSGYRCSGDSLNHGSIIGVKATNAVHIDARPPFSAASGHRDVDRRAVGLRQTLVSRSGDVAEDGACPAGKHSRHPPAIRGQHRMAHRENADMNSVQPSRGHTVLYGASAETQGDELLMRDDTVLARSDLRNRPITWST